jgi:hypothetical protein
MEKSVINTHIQLALLAHHDFTSADGAEIAQVVNKELRLRGEQRITNRNVAAVKAHLSRNANAEEAVGLEATVTKGQARIAKNIAANVSDQELTVATKLLDRLMHRHGDMGRVGEILSQIISLSSSLNNSPQAAAELIRKVRE